jgi:hypothetical protein
VVALRLVLLALAALPLPILASCGAPDTSPASGGGASTDGGSGGEQAGPGGTGGFSGYAAAGGAFGGTGGGGSGGAGATGTGGSGAETSACAPMPACDGPLPDVGPKRSWKHTSSTLIAASGFANHRGRDLLLTPTNEQWIIGKFAYGVFDKDLKDEEVDVWLDRDCGSSWEKLGTALTTEENQHPTVEGVSDSGGRVYFQIPNHQQLGIGRHRARLVVAGDLSAADVLIEVLPPGVRFFVTDVDGTLSSKETEEYGALLTGTVSDVRPDAATALGMLAQKGYRPFYLSARPEFLVGRTREFVQFHGFPLGLVHTTTALGATGSAALTFKKAELGEAIGRGAQVDWAFGNTASDADAYFLAGVQPNDHRIFIQYTDTANSGRRIESYAELHAEIAALPEICP